MLINIRIRIVILTIVLLTLNSANLCRLSFSVMFNIQRVVGVDILHYRVDFIISNTITLQLVECIF